MATLTKKLENMRPRGTFQSLDRSVEEVGTDSRNSSATILGSSSSVAMA